MMRDGNGMAGLHPIFGTGMVLAGLAERIN